MKKINHINNHDKQISAAELVFTLTPFNKNTQVTPKNCHNICDRIAIALKLALEAITHFQHDRLEKFDAHVGDTACQIRAFITLCLAKKHPNFTHDIQTIKQLLKHLQDLKLLLAPSNIEMMLEPMDSTHSLSITTPYLAACYILAKYVEKDEEALPQRINKKHFQAENQQTRKFTEKLLHKLQVFVSEYSCRYIIHLYTSSAGLKASASLEKAIRQGDEDRYAMPAYASMHIIQQHLLTLNTTILLKVKHGKQLHMLWFSVNNGNVAAYKPVPNAHNTHCICIYGHSNADMTYADLKRNLTHLMQNQLKLLRFSFATHPQYPGSTLSALCELFPLQSADFFPHGIDEDFHTDYLMSTSLGCNISNHALFLIKHVYASTLFTENRSSQKLQKNTSHITIVQHAVDRVESTQYEYETT